MFLLILSHPSQENSLLILKMDNYNSPPFIFVIVDFLASVNKEIWYLLSAVYL